MNVNTLLQCITALAVLFTVLLQRRTNQKTGEIKSTLTEVNAKADTIHALVNDKYARALAAAVGNAKSSVTFAIELCGLTKSAKHKAALQHARTQLSEAERAVLAHEKPMEKPMEKPAEKTPEIARESAPETD